MSMVNGTSARSMDSGPEIVVSRRQMVTASVASLLGWSLDLFDLFILLYVAPVIGKLFFPADVPTLSLAAVYASFAVTLLMRPIGSALFGSYADRFGRKRSMIIAVTGVGISTALFGALPTVQQIGVSAAILFLILRLVQGIFVGGVVASTHTIGTESVPPKYRGLMSGLIGGGGAGLGALLASIVYYIVSSAYPGDEFNVWGWRFMFFTGIISSILGLFVFKSLEESPLWLQAKQKKTKEAKPEAPVRTIFSQYLPVLLVNLMLVTGGGTAYYLTSGYLPTFLNVINKLPRDTASMILMGASVMAIISAILFGYLSDIIGRKKTFILIGIVNLFTLPFLYLGLGGATSIASITFYAMALVFLGNAAYAPILIFLNERFPTAIRSTGTGLSWNMGFAVGGMMPTFVSLASGTTENIPYALMYFSIGVFVLYVIGSFVVPETKGNFD
ncbi:MFS transporter [Brevibacillus agri]|uniref:MFS transporter n=1 Tax=Brevibacillus agri TaxID=51101 RepID=UPI002E22E648|nr:MFS transporter [Brevibacillus agri]MED1644420.1 MFS transporter [Brevibacillus agri]MED1657214.1 MFS transporter [Brevibacillus agri]MED1689621.1 MFS transporter [Brevibacillus agri]MED1693907.1 MFS transporter [Brevibacillus agri]MED1698283.1 MFS transporter [Brevibacillus agri]